MAEQTEITNVGGEGVASEVTLANLLAVTEQMAKKAGVDPKDVTKKLKALSTATEDTIKVSTKNRNALGKNTKEVDKSTGAFRKLGGMLGGAVLSSFSAVARSGTEMTRAFINGETSLTAFAQHLPLVGNQLSILTGLFDSSFSAFQSVATSGAAFNNSLTELRNTAAGARMPLEQFASLVGANSDKLAALGGTATRGAQQIATLNKALGSNRNDLLNMGMNYQEINEALIDFQYLQRAGNRGRRLEGAAATAQADAAARYTKNLLTLSKLTGEDVKTQQAKIAQAQMDVAMQAKLARMTPEAREKFNDEMALAATAGGDALVNELKRQFLGMPPMTEEAALYVSQFGENVALVSRRLEGVYDANVTAADMAASSTDYMVQAIKNNAAAFGRLEPGLTAAAAGLDGPMAILADQLLQAGIQFTDFIDADSGEVDEVRLAAAIDAAKAESAARDSTTNSVASFMDTLTAVQRAFQTNIVSPLMDAVAPAFESIIKALAPVDENGDPIEGSGFATAIEKISNYINNDLAPGILEFIKAFKDDPMGTIKEYFNTAISGLGNLIKDFFLGPMMTGPLMPGQEREREGGFLQETLLPIITELGTGLVNGMVEGVKYLWENTSIIETMIAGIAALWAGKAIVGAMISGVGGLLAAGVRRIGSAPLPQTPRTTVPTPGATPPATPDGPDGGRGGSRLGRAARFLGRGAKFIPGVGLIAAGAMGAFDAASGFSADPNAGLGESLANAGSSALNGLTFGLLGRSPDEIAADAAASGAVGDESESTSTPTPEAPTIESPAAQLAMMLTPEQITAMERLAAINLSTFNTGLSTLLETDLSAFRIFSRLDITEVAEGFRTFAAIPNIASNFQALSTVNLDPFTTSLSDFTDDVSIRTLNRFSNLDFTTVSAGLRGFAEIPNLATNFDAIKSLDAGPVRTYTEAIDGLVESLNRLNEELSRDNDTMFTNRADAGELLSGISTSTSGTSLNTEQLNNTMQQVLMLLTEMRDLDIDVEKNTRNIIGSNLAQGGVSNVAR